MLLSARRQFIFVHVYKVAGESIKTALQPYAIPSVFDRVLAKVGVATEAMRVYRLGWQSRKHAMAKDAKAMLSPEIFDRTTNSRLCVTPGIGRCRCITTCGAMRTINSTRSRQDLGGLTRI
jgi:hypothetical protein